jgi:hypothetical protein
MLLGEKNLFRLFKMPKNQLFRIIPPMTMCLRVLATFGLKGLNDTTNFSRKDLAATNCVGKMNAIKNELCQYYLPCKFRTYLSCLSSKNVVTILRQIVRLYGYSVGSREKYIKGDKFIIYQLIETEKRNYNPITISTYNQDKKSCIVTFD